ncbi:hypothetical protein DPMN_022107 [Dreissena polymorpha]|uniref:Uncharacterized protein n=1 Tax=Dreissena polymorpha TaxID=45954 RepID=A0A9D4NNW7_DREPO|nr:hypothetical protein DPMN_022107 [Dreissena polymorpha]
MYERPAFVLPTYLPGRPSARCRVRSGWNACAPQSDAPLVPASSDEHCPPSPLHPGTLQYIGTYSHVTIHTVREHATICERMNHVKTHAT